jgi:penicillin-binding protein 1A
MSPPPSRLRHVLTHPARASWAAVRRHPWLALAALPLLAFIAAVAAVAFYIASLVPQTPGVIDLKALKVDQPSVLLTSDGQELAVLRKTHREWVKLADISPHVMQGLLATEDQRFYSHRGLDLRRTVGAAINTLRGRLQGGSTLTQQLARNLFPEEIGREATVERKVKEAITALRIESAYGKDEILETYLNTVPFLYNVYGIEMAARTYFDKSARELDVLESATLVGMLKGTTYYNPVLNPERARQRRNIVLAQMARAGHLDGGQLQALRQRPLQLAFERPEEQPGPAPHFTAMARRWLFDWADRHGYNVYADGLVVRTTIDSRAQALATEALARQAERLQKLADAQWNGRRGWDAQTAFVDMLVRETPAYRKARDEGLDDREALRRLRADADFMRTLRQDKTRLQAGLVAIEPGTGFIRAWVGSRDFAQDQFDHVQQARRQPGSTFKPFVYGAAFALGAHPGDTLPDQLVELPQPTGEVWRPRDPGEPTGEPITLAEALAHSRNRITAQLVQHVQPGLVAELARGLGVRDSRLETVPSLGLGTSPVTLREMVTAYGSIANGGQYVAPSWVLRVEDRQGRVLEAFQPAAAQPILDPVPNAVLLDAMRAAVDRGTGAAIRTRHGLQGELAGKTGTTQDNTDGWFILMHPRLVAGAWVGFNDSRITMQDAWGQGARSALPMVGDFFQQLAKARLVDTKARFPRNIDPAAYEQAVAGWGSLLPEPAPPPQQQAPEWLPAMPPVPAEIAVLPGPGVGMPATVVGPAIPVQRAIVVAPPRTPEPAGTARVGPPGEASGAGPAWRGPPGNRTALPPGMGDGP